MTIITSKANSLIKQAKKLQQKKYRTTSYLIEGWHLVEEARLSGAEMLRVFVLAEEAYRVSDLSQAVIVSPEVLRELSDSPSPQGIVAEVAISHPDVTKLEKGRYLVLEDIQDPGNVGTMIRTADAAGFDGVLISHRTADIYNQKTLRSMQGSHFHLPIYRLPIEEIVSQLKAIEVPVLATTLSEHSVDYRTLTSYDHFALVMGNEGSGISAAMAEQADELVHIPMPGRAESLNVAVAAGIMMFSLVNR
ncbi:TrmH family RNA methyltransferase [Streptococcus entericus]|uniref:TrmH family RNA methyltransferase n=1 Tax=Streptococcus entericus TaxID=155680 RepID=UPI0003747661|nr:RNA methyltransferase [Streptococcus entericus]